MRRISISVIIPTIGRVNLIERCIESVLNQTLTPHEIVIVDSDENLYLKEKLEEKNWERRIRYIYDPTKSLCKKKNIGVNDSSGDILFFFDDDVVLDEKYIEEVVKVFKTDEDGRIGGVMGNITNWTPRDTVSLWILLTRIFFLGHFGNGKFLPSGCATFVHGKKKIVETKFLSGGISAYRREVFKDFKFDEKLGRTLGYCSMEDIDFSYRLSKRYNLIYTPYATLKHFPSWTRSNTYDEGKVMEHKILNHYYLFRKNMPLHFRNIVAFTLSLFGRLILSLIFERNSESIRGWITGTLKIL